MVFIRTIYCRKDTATSNPFSTASGADGDDDLLGDTVIEEAEVDWDVPTIAEESLDKLTTMFTIYPE